MRTNTKIKHVMPVTHEGARAVRITPEQQLRRSVMNCLLFENEFYESGETIADRIKTLVMQVDAQKVASIAIEARTKMHLRHVPLLIAACLAGRKLNSSIVSETICAVIQRADELCEFVAIYAKVNGVTLDKVKPKLSNQVRKGLAAAFVKFGPYSLAKYNRDGAVKLRDVLFLSHAKPVDDALAATWKQLIDGTLPAPDTWEVQLSAGADKKETWERLIREGKLGYFALIRNLRNMELAGVDHLLVGSAILARGNGAQRVLPFRYVAAARHAPRYEPMLDMALCAAIAELPKLPGRTVVLVDVSGSMNMKLSGRSEMSRMDAAATLASMINADDLRVFSFSTGVKEVPPRRGMAGVDAIARSQPHGGTALFAAVAQINARVPHDRLIVITDEQALPQSSYASWRGGAALKPVAQHAYVINVASARNGVGYGNGWTHIDGWSEHVLRWIVEHEGLQAGSLDD